MSEDFLNILYNEEEAVYNKVLKSPLYEELLTIQRLISQKGGSPKYILKKIELLNIKERRIGRIFPKSEHAEGYGMNWIWDKKTKFAFLKLNRTASPKEVIDILLEIEGVATENEIEKTRIANNVYNSITKLKRSGVLIRDETSEYPLYTYINEEALF